MHENFNQRIDETALYLVYDENILRELVSSMDLGRTKVKLCGSFSS
jgi:hypothetical protein